MKPRINKLFLWIVLFYFFLGLIQIKLPGPQVDEVKPAIGTMQIIRGDFDNFLPSVRLFGRWFPLMIASYDSALESYLILPFFLLFGINIYVLRFCWIFWGAITLLLAYMVTREFFDEKRAILFSFLLGINPMFILGTRIGGFSCVTLLTIIMAILLCFIKWLKGEGKLYFLFGIFLFGLGLSLRAWFFWFIGGLLFSSFIFLFPLRNKINLDKTSFKYAYYLCGGILSFLLGSFLTLYYNLLFKFDTVRVAFSNIFFSKKSLAEITYFDHLIARIVELKQFLGGVWFISELGSWHNRPSSEITANPIYWVLFLCSLIWFIYYIICKKNMMAERKKRLFLLILVVGIVALSVFPRFTFSLGGPRGFMTYPFLILCISVAFIDIRYYFKKKFVSIILVFSFVLLVIFEFDILKQNYFFLKKTGGTGNFSDAVYELSDWLTENRTFRPRGVDWGFDFSLLLLSKGKVVAKNIYSLVTQAADGWNYNLVDEGIEKGDVYLLHAPDFSNLKNCNERFKKSVQSKGGKLVELKRFCQRDGNTVYLVYSVR